MRHLVGWLLLGAFVFSAVGCSGGGGGAPKGDDSMGSIVKEAEKDKTEGEQPGKRKMSVEETPQ